MLKKSSKYIYFLLLFYFLWLIVLPFTFNQLFKVFSADIFNAIKTNFGINLEIKNLRLRTSVLPNITIKTDELAVINKDLTKPLEIKKAKVNIRIFPLIIGKLHINKLGINSIDTSLKIANNKLYLGDYILPKMELNLQPNKLKINKIKINEYNLTLLENGRVTRFHEKNLLFKNTRKHIVFKLKSTINSDCELNFDLNLPKNHKKSKSKCNIEIKNLDLARFSPILTNYIPELQATSGRINAITKNDKLSTRIKNLKILYKTPEKSIIFPSLLEVNSRFKVYNNMLNIKSASVNSENIKATANGRIKNLFSSKPKFDIKTTIEHIELRTGALMLPNITTDDISTEKLKKHAFYGDMTGSMQIKGDFPQPDILGELKIRNGVLVKPIKNAKGKANIDINFIGQKLLLKVDVPAGDNEWVKVNGDISIYGDKFTHLFIKSSENVDLDTAEFVVNRLHDVFRFEVGPVPIMDIKGRGNANLKIVGTKKDPHIDGEFRFKNTDARFLEINNLVLKNADGFLKFTDQLAYFINKTGKVNNQPATIEGTCTLFGDLDFNVTAKNQKLDDLIKILTTSPMLTSLKTMVPPVKNITGNADFILNLKGEKVMHIEDLKINENVIAKGYIKLLGNSLNFEGLNLKELKGLINYNKTDCELDLKGKLNKNSNITIQGKLKDSIADISINSPKISVNDLQIKELKFLDPLFIKLKARYKGKLEKIAIGGIDAQIDVLKTTIPVKNCKVSTGQINLKNSNLKIHNLSGYVKQNPFYINATVNNLGKEDLNIKTSTLNGSFKCNNFDLTAINTLKNLDILSPDLQTQLKNITIIKGVTDINFYAKNNNINSTLNLNNINFTYSITEGEKQEKVDIPVNLINGQIELKNDTISLKKLNCLIDEMPILIFGKLNNIYKNPKYNIYINSKLIQKVFTKYWNAHNIYPIKLTGDIVSTIILSGDKTHTHINTNTKLEEGSEIYYMGASIGSPVAPITLKTDLDIYKKDLIKINKFSYNKVISSQNNKQNELPLLKINGEIKKNGKVYNFKDITIKSENPADANLFNIIFKKPTIKQGTFVSDLKITGNSTTPKIIGKFNLANVEMPYLNTSIKELTLDFKPTTIELMSKGEVMSNYIMGTAEFNNVLTPPYTVNNAYIYINSLDVNHLITQLKQLELKGISSAISTEKDNESTNYLDMFKIKTAKIRAGEIIVKNIVASNLEAICGFTNKDISIDSFNFNMANGIISGNLKYNLVNNYMSMILSANKVNANSLTTALFDLPNQIFGELTGQVEFSCDTTSDKTRNETLSGFGNFNVTDGKMPKLGSLEYLLKAGNLLRGGITSISMNSIIDIVTPLKTGEFSSIHGRFRIKDGIAKTIEIHSHGKNLNLYITGTYDFIRTSANMNVYGQISRKVSTILGAAGNISLNTLFNKIPGVSNSLFINELNKIPGIDLSNKSTRRFVVEILGDINGEDFVQSFKWIN